MNFLFASDEKQKENYLLNFVRTCSLCSWLSLIYCHAIVWKIRRNQLRPSTIMRFVDVQFHRRALTLFECKELIMSHFERLSSLILLTVPEPEEENDVTSFVSSTTVVWESVDSIEMWHDAERTFFIADETKLRKSNIFCLFYRIILLFAVGFCFAVDRMCDRAMRTTSRDEN